MKVKRATRRTRAGQLQRQTAVMNTQLVQSAVQQHETAEIAQKLNTQLQDEIAERKQVEQELRKSEERYRALFNLGPVAIYSIDAAGVIQNFNHRAAELWGRAPALGDTDARFCGSFKMFRPDGSFLPPAQCPMADVVSGKLTGARDAEVYFERPDGSRVTVVVNIRPLKNERGEITGAINCFHDITARKQAEEALRQSEARISTELAAATQLQGTSTFLIQGGNPNALYKEIIETAVVLMHSDMGSLQMFYPDRGELRLLAWKGFKLESAAFWEWVRPRSSSSCGVALHTGRRIIVPDVETADFMANTRDLDAYRKSGIRAVQSTPLLSRDGKVVGMISTHWRKTHEPSAREMRLLDVLARQAADLLERTRAEDALQQAQSQLADRAGQLELLVAERTTKLTAAHRRLLAEARRRKHLEGEIARAVEHEQLRLGQELHDGLAQELTASAMLLYALQLKLEKEALTSHIGKLQEVYRNLLETANKARNLATGFYPVDLKEYGLVGALRGLARRTQESFGILCAVESAGKFPDESNDDWGIQLFRIAQEALHNATKHSRAKHIVIRLTMARGACRLTVEDDGIGLRSTSRRSAGMGIHLMHHRTGMIGGTIEVRNAEAGGVLVSCVVPGPKPKGKE